MIVLDVAYVFELAGGTRGPRNLQTMLARHVPDAQLNYPVVQMWLQRGKIPARWIPPVLYALSREGHDLLPLFVDDQELSQHHEAA